MLESSQMVQVAETLRTTFPFGVAVLQHMLEKQVLGVSLISAGLLRETTLTPSALFEILWESAHRDDHEAVAATVETLEAGFREAASVIGIEVQIPTK